MQFTLTPQPFAPLGGKLRYAVDAGTATRIDIRIADRDGKLLGTKRFVDVASASFDIAPYLRQVVRFTPVVGTTDIYTDSGRTVTAAISAETPDGEAAIAAVRTFLPTAVDGPTPRLLTSLPRQRLISPDECEELSLFTTGAHTLTLIVQAGDTTIAENFSVSTAGLHLLRLDVSDFPGANSITVDAGSCGAIEYTVVPTAATNVRLAWRSNAGSIEHYTFPVVTTKTVEAAKKRAYGPDGHIASATELTRTVIASAYEAPPMLEGLAGLLSSPQVWRVEGGGYTPVEVVTEQAVVQRLGTMSSLEIEIRSTVKTPQPWN